MPRVVSSGSQMTYEDSAAARRPSVGTKVLMVGLAVFAVLGSFWTIVWFIRAYVEAPRVNIAPIALAARESTPVVPSAPAAPPAPIAADTAQATTANPPSAPSPPAQGQADPPATTNAIADRWLPMTPAEPPAPPHPAAPLPGPPAGLARAPPGSGAADRGSAGEFQPGTPRARTIAAAKADADGRN